MESTATYWKPVFYALEDQMGTWLFNATHMKAVPGRKSDVRDAEWIAQLLEHGLVAPSFVPAPQIRRLRNLTRYRVQLMGDRTRDVVRLDHVQAALVELDATIAAAMTPWAHELELLQTIPGVGPKTAQVIIAETGGGMAQFPTAAHLAAWAGVAPAMHESACKRFTGRIAQGYFKFLSSMLVEAASSVSRTKNTYLGAQHARIASRRGKKRAALAVAHSMLGSAYYMLQRDEPYRELGVAWFDQRHADAHTRRLVVQLKALGHTVVLDPAI